MKSKYITKNQTKLTKTAKATLPFFALFGGQGFASSRNPLTLQSSKKEAARSVVYINSSETPALPNLSNQLTTNTKTPFAAFTKNSVFTYQTAKIEIQTKALDYLKQNDLLMSNNSLISSISGNTKQNSRKAFSHTFMFINSNSTGTEQCNNVSAYKSFKYFKSIYTSSTYSCTQYTTASTGTGASTMCLMGTSLPLGINTFITCSLIDNSSIVVSTGFDTGACQVQHQKCAGHTNLPVELQKYEIE